MTLWLANVAIMSELLFASVHDTLLELLGDAKYLGAEARHHRHAAHVDVRR